ncbi:MAG: C10 family peptidase [Candidatus Krumholzibacteria bacterium]|nr:C10 family peptidase [Candidatus Krumholzibacteria bacterium]
MLRVAKLDLFPRMTLVIAVLGIVFLLISQPAHARPKTADEAQAAVQTWLQKVLTEGPENFSVQSMEPYQYQGGTVAYIAHLWGGGYCLVGADDLSRPIIYYGLEGEYDPTNPGLRFFLENTGQSLLALRTAVNDRSLKLQPIQDKLQARADLWSDLIAGRKPVNKTALTTADVPDYLVLPLTSKWHQNAPYNLDTPYPIGPPNDMISSKVGCLATAMSQVMYYWKWPTRGASSRQVFWANHHFDYWNTRPLDTDPGIDPAKWSGRLEWTDTTSPPELRIGGVWDGSMYTNALKESTDPAYQSAVASIWQDSQIEFRVVEGDFQNTYYDWDLMQDEHFSADGIDAGDLEAARLGFQAACAVDMNWGRYVSLATTGDVPWRMPGYFKYDTDMTYISHNSQVMIEDLSWSRPLIFRASNATGGGHAWVVFGYDISSGIEIFMINLGWGPSSIGWFTLDDINLDYYLNLAHVSKIAPEYSVRFVGSNNPFGDGTPSSPYFSLSTALINAPDDVTFILQAGSTNVISGAAAVIDSPHVIKGLGAIITYE